MLDEASQSHDESTTGLTNEITIETNLRASASPLTAYTVNEEHAKFIRERGK